MVAEGWEWEPGLTVKGHKGMLSGEDDILKQDYGDSRTTW